MLKEANEVMFDVQLCSVVDGGWSIWYQWSECSVTCSNGTQTRERACDSPAPAHGGRECEGDRNQTRGCFLRHCPGELEQG